MPLANDECDAVFGSRMMIAGKALKGGMPYWKYGANIFLTKIENAILGLHLSEYHSGFRAYSAKALRTVPFDLNSNDFVFDTEIIIQLLIHGFEIKEVPIATRYFKDASMIGFFSSVKYGLLILHSLIKYRLTKWRIRTYEQFQSSK
ncbi:MAG: Glycosyl transferase, group 2 family protein [uncultured bacterium]|nr:MAG: Glycosyl transferase, group 2 family protein [uncultured bacterium]